MYFTDKNNTNIDDEFQKDNILSKLLNLINKYKIIIIIAILLIIVIVIFYIYNNGTISTENTYYLELSGSEKITLYTGSDYIEPGYDAYNSKKEDMDSEVEISSNIDVNVPGEYTITYTIGKVTKNRKVIVIEKPTEYTYIYLKTINNNVNVYIKVGEKYVEPGYTVFSSSGKNLTSDVTVTGAVDTTKKGTYKLVYSLVDPNGVTVSTSRTVIVMDSEISLTLSTSEYTNKDVTINVQVIDNYFDYMILPDKSKITKSNTSYKISENGTYRFVVYSTKGTKKEASINVDNIDKNAPTGTCNGSYKNGTSTININASDNVGIKKYVINNKEYTSNKITLNSELKTVSITIYDKADNTKNISCNLENKSNPKPSSSSSNNQSKITNNLFVGDSRTVGMCESYKICQNSEYIAEVSKRYSWFENNAIPEINKKITDKNYNIIILMGVNDVSGTEEKGKNAATKYYNKISSLATTTWKNQNIVFVSVNPVLDGYSYAYTVAVNAFNKEMKSQISSSNVSNLKYCDTNSKLNIDKSNAKDGLHYNKETYQQIYNIIISKCL